MAGKALRLVDAGYDVPKPLVSVLGKTIVQWSIETLGLKGNYIFCCKQEHIEKYNIDKILKEIIVDSEVISIDYQTRGTLESVLEARNKINNDEELIISDTDHCLIWDPTNFDRNIRCKDIDACVMVFPKPTYSKAASYVKLNKDGYVIKSAEKIPISTTATVGLHYFKRGSDFVKYADKMIEQNISYKNEFYVTPIYSLLAAAGKKIITSPVKKMWALGNPNEINLFIKEYSNKTHSL